MSTPEVPAALKAIVPYLQRAQEIEKIEPTIAYYSRFFAVKLGISKKQSKDDEKFLLKIMDKLEQDKKKLGTIDEEDSKLQIEGFALKIFSKADNEDRAGNATKTTAQAFYAAAIFLDVLKQFGELVPELEERQKYARWKAADITRCIKLGIKPKSGPENSDDSSAEQNNNNVENEATDMPQINNNNNNNQGPSVVKPTNQSGYQNPNPENTKSTATPPSNSPKSVTQQNKNTLPPQQYAEPEPDNSSSYNPEAVAGLDNAKKFTKFALSALQFDDVPTAIKNLTLALNTLKNLSHKN